MAKKIKVNFRDLMTVEYDADTKIIDMIGAFQHYFQYPILVAQVDNDIVELGTELSKNCRIDFYDRSSRVGNAVYENSLQFILVLAFHRVLGEKADIILENSIDKGIYCEARNADVNSQVIKKVDQEMREIIKSDLIFTKVNVDRLDAIKFYEKKKQLDKARGLKYISNSFVNLYRLDNLYDYFYSDLAYSTKDMDDFKLTFIKDNGFVLSFPSVTNPECTLDYVHHKMLFEEFNRYTKWATLQKISNAADLNEVVSTGFYADLIMLTEVYQSRHLMKIADDIYKKRDQIKVVLVAGPSSSGKTTTSKKLAIYLRSLGIKTHQLSVDDYFKNRDETPLKADGNPDFESIRAIDTNLFNKHLMKLLNHEKVLMPEFNFVIGKKEYKDKTLQIGPEDIIIIEGLHTFNEELTLSIERKNKYKVYVCPLTQMNIDSHNRVHTSDVRKLRRMIRDNLYRGYKASDTLRQWPHIREGEEEYIFPYQDDADVVMNTALLYEIGILKTYAEPLLFSVSEKDENYAEAIRLINFLRNFLPIPSESVPHDSILREFIGESYFHKK